MSEFENIRYMPIVTIEQTAKFRNEALRIAKDLDYANKELGSKQAKIDALMLEYCPDEMTQEQIENWENHQQPVMEDVKTK